jgi:hypothetical protein
MGNEVNRTIVAVAALIVATCVTTSASAGLFADDFARCLVKSSSAEDKTVLIQWIFAAITLNPAVGSISSLSADQRDALNKKTAVLFERLVFTDCHSEAVQAMHNEGDVAMETAFQTLGQVAAQGMLSDPAVTAGLSDLSKHMNKSKWEQLGKDAAAAPALSPPPAGTPPKQ